MTIAVQCLAVLPQPTTRVTEAEKEELEALRRSRTLAKSPSLLRLFEYLSQSYLDETAAQLTEYSIALDCLNKTPDFDPKLNSIVRVEASRLRKKLKLYYESEGSGRPLEVILEQGQYVLRFRPRALPEPPVQEAVTEEIPLPPPPPAPSRNRMVALACVAVCAVAVIGVLLGRERAAETVPPEIRMICGNRFGLMVDSMGLLWSRDQYFEGGSEFAGDFQLASHTPVEHDESARVGNFDYSVPLVPNYPYVLRLYFSPVAGRKPEEQTTRTHRFNVFANGVTLIDARDPSAATAFSEPEMIRVFQNIRAGSDGRLRLSFRSAQDRAYVNAIELMPSASGHMQPIRILAQATHYRDTAGTRWNPDRFVIGGFLVMRTKPITGHLDPNLFAGERYGSFVYHFPVAKAKYSLNLYFAETWFGQFAEAAGGVGSRRFDVLVNGTPLLQDFDVWREAGASNHGIVKSFHGVSPDSNGYINLAFIPRVDNAEVNAIELIEETP